MAWRKQYSPQKKQKEFNEHKAFSLEIDDDNHYRGFIEDFNKYFLEVFPELHNDILNSLSGLRKMISMEV